MATIYQEQPRTADGSAAGLVAGLVLVLAVIALVFLATQANLGGTSTNIIDATPANNGTRTDLNESVNGTVNGAEGATVQ